MDHIVLKPGQRFISRPGDSVRVNSVIENGFSITIEDNNIRVYDRSRAVGAPNGLAGMVPTACVIPGLGVYSITYWDDVPERGDNRYHLQSLWFDSTFEDQGAHWTDLTVATAPPLWGTTSQQKNPIAYVDTSRNTEIVLWNSTLRLGGGTGDVMGHWYSRSPNQEAGVDNLTSVAGLDNQAWSGEFSNAVGYYSPADDTHHVIFIREANWHILELFWTGNSRVQQGGDLSGHALGDPAPGANSLGSAFIGAQGVNIVLYRGDDSHIHSLYWKGTDDPRHDNLSYIAGTPLARRYAFSPHYSPDPVGYYTAHNDTHQVVYRGVDEHLYELYWQGNERVIGWDITDRTTGAPLASYPVCNFTAYYSAGTNTKHVIYVTDDNHLHDITWPPGRPDTVRTEHFDLTTLGLPALAHGRPAAFTIEGPNTQHVAYRGGDNHIYEVIW